MTGGAKPRIRSGTLAMVAVLLVSRSVSAWPDGLERRPQQVVVEYRDADPRPTLGPRYAPVTMDVFIDLDNVYSPDACIHLVELSARHPRRLRVVFYLLGGAGRSSLVEAAIEAHVQGRFFEFMDAVAAFTQQRRRLPSEQDPSLEAVSESAGVDFGRVRVAARDKRHVPMLEQNELLRRRRGAPDAKFSLVLNGVISGLLSREASVARLEQEYDGAYAVAKRKLDAGAAVQDIYHLALIEVDAAHRPVQVNAGLVSGEQARERPSLLEDAPLIDPRARRGGYSMGPVDARVNIHFFCDFSGYKACRGTRAALESVRDHYPGLVRLWFHHMLPDELDADERAQLLRVHVAGACAQELGVFEGFYRRIYSIPSRRRRQVTSPNELLDRVLETLDVSPERLAACMTDPAKTQEVEDLVRAAREAGITTSPTVVVGDRAYPGSKEWREILGLVEIELMPGLLEQLAPSPAGSPDWIDAIMP